METPETSKENVTVGKSESEVDRETAVAYATGFADGASRLHWFIWGVLLTLWIAFITRRFYLPQ